MPRITQAEKTGKKNVMPRAEYERDIEARRSKGKTKTTKPKKPLGRGINMSDAMGETIERGAAGAIVVKGSSYEVGTHDSRGVHIIGNVGNALTRGATFVTPEPVPFYPPNITASLPVWDSEKADPDDNWVITQVPDTHKNKTQKDLLADNQLGGVFFVPRVWNELQYLVNSLAGKTGECAFFVTVKRLSKQRPHWLAYDWFMPKQNASGAEVSLSVEDTQRYFSHLMEKYPTEFPDLRTTHQNTMHAHSHHTMALCNWSGVDDKQQTTRDELGFQSDYRLFFLFTIGHGFKCSLAMYDPILVRKDCFIGVCYAEPTYIVSLTNKRKKELDEMMDKLVHGRGYAYNTGAYGQAKGYATYTPHTSPAYTKPAVTHQAAAADAEPFYWRGELEDYDYYPTRKGGVVHQQASALPIAQPKNIASETNNLVTKSIVDHQNSVVGAKKDESESSVSTWADKKKVNSLFDLIRPKDHKELRENLDTFTGKMAVAVESLMMEDMVDLRELDETQLETVQSQLMYNASVSSIASVPYGPETQKVAEMLEEMAVKYVAVTMYMQFLEDPGMNPAPESPDFYTAVLKNATTVIEAMAEFVTDAACLMVVPNINPEKAAYYYKSGLLNYEFTNEDLEALALAIEDDDYELLDLAMSVLPAF